MEKQKDKNQRRNDMKRIMAALLALCVTAGTVSYPAGMHEAKAAEAREAGNAESIEDGFEYEELANGTVKITDYKGSGTEAVIPSEINGKTVVIIGNQTFSKCSNLISITIPFGVTNIGERDYAHPNPETDVFSECHNLKEVIVDSENVSYSSKDGLLYNDEKTELFLCPAAKTGSIIIEEGIKSLNAIVFQNCCNLTDMTIPASVTSINLQFSSGCYMAGCSSLREITVADDNVSYSSQDGILYNKEKTQLLCCPPGKVGNVIIPDGMIDIDSAAFQNCSSLTNIVIPDGVNRIGWLAFQNCSSLSSVAIPRSVSQIEFSDDIWTSSYNSPFQNCSGLTEITVNEENATYASSDGMLFTKDMGRLLCCPAGQQGEVSVPDGVTGISIFSFDDCNGLKKIMIPKSVSFIDEPNEDLWRCMTFGTCRNLEEISVDVGNKTYSSLDGILYSKDMTQLKCCPPGKEGDMAVPSGIIEMNKFSLCNCRNLTSIWIPQSVEKIGAEYKDEDCEYTVFVGCIDLAEITVEDQNENYSSFDGVLYAGDSLKCCPAGKQEGVVIKEDISSIGSHSFQNCVNLISLQIPQNVHKIGLRAFWGCIQLGNVIMPEKLSMSVMNKNGNVFENCGEELCLICVEGSVAESYAIQYGINYKTVEKEKELQYIYASDITKTVGDMPFFIHAELDGNGILSYESSDESVASVTSEGIIIIYSVGTAQMTIRASETEEYKAAQKVITITVNPASGAGENPPPADLAGTSYDIGGCTYTITSTEPKEACFTSLNDDRTVVTIPNLVTINGSTYEVSSIAERACYGIEALQRVRVGANVKEIGAGAFAGCTALEQAIVPESVQTIGEGAFAGSSEGLCMVCARGSAAEAYAVENGIRHKASADEKEPQTITAGDFEKTFGDGPFPIGASTDGDGALSYESDNEAVAVVSAKGTVVLMGAGTARITIKASETENYGPAEKTIAVTVSPKPGGDQKPGGTQKPEAGGSSQEKPENKKAQTVTAADLAKTYGDRPFSIGAKSSGGGALSYAVKNPAVASVDGNGTVTLKGCGVTEIVITAAANGRYQAASKTITLTVAPKKLSGTSAKSTKAKTLTVKWKKDKAATGYIIECSTDKKFRKNVKTATVKKNKTVSKKLTNLKGGKRYYVRACAYVQAGGAKIKGAYRTVKKAVKVKK